ncbi:DUF4893 domain-containing protein [Sphingomonas sabuli]|uniref:DUF4893 domain-containing protein n=1 Tax=Sphingomonas sabuli TaxID=2764186 RepID=A0A7G9L0P8_9SPHN|nr:DUF4893 domain-containing protein [Sphingomonas sabuli]QNM82197.1 DUF4893 domain-containing protein [Sphingomonas sabuli]
MRTSAILLAMALAATLGACDTTSKKRTAATITVEQPQPGDAWKQTATPSDRSRIDRSGLAWQQGIDEARARFGRAVAGEGELLKPLARLPRPQPTPGSYNCRLISIGKTDRKSPAFEKFKPFFCYVLSDDDGSLSIVKQTGSRRPVGQLFDDADPNRMIFLGSLGLADDKESRAYGEDPERDMAGVFERIAPFRWRLVIPWARSGAKLEVFELTPVADQPE